MCGIAGAIGLAAEPGRACVAAMLATIIHRGPDDSGVLAQDGLALGIQRLSIIDLEHGHQPMTGETGVSLVFNGEIYNHGALREELRAQGSHFHTRSDTEVLLRGYETWGLSVVDRLRGMFAFCVHDPATRQIHLVRDRIGKKPLYYAFADGALHFASEIKALLAVPGRARPSLDGEALDHYLTFRYVPSPMTVWQDIAKVEPGHVLTYALEDGAMRITPYWTLNFASEPNSGARDPVEEFSQLFLEAVQLRLEAADVPVGVLLSGGLDSSAVGAAAIELGHRAFHTFSVGFSDGGEMSELGYARRVADHIGSIHHEVIIDHNDFVELLPRIVHATDEPLADLACVPLHAVCALAHNDVKVVLSGEGADEMLAGYDMDRLAQRLDRLSRIDRFMPRTAWTLAAKLLPERHRAIAGAMASGGPANYLRDRLAHISWVWSEAEKEQLWRTRPPRQRDSDALLRSRYDRAESAEPLDRYMEVLARDWLVEDLLMKADKTSMANSIELRCPFLDHRVVEFAERLPLVWKVGDAATGWTTKRILLAFAASRLPAEILTRPKLGFPVPGASWLAGPLRGWAENTLSSPHIDAMFDTRLVRTSLTQAVAGDPGAVARTWSLLVLAVWMDAWL